jgi:hypothetical protein
MPARSSSVIPTSNRCPDLKRHPPDAASRAGAEGPKRACGRAEQSLSPSQDGAHQVGEKTQSATGAERPWSRPEPTRVGAKTLPPHIQLTRAPQVASTLQGRSNPEC